MAYLSILYHLVLPYGSSLSVSHTHKKVAISRDLFVKRYPATVASVASLLTQWVCGCNEFYHLKYLSFVFILSNSFFLVKNLAVSKVTIKPLSAYYPP